MRIADKLRAFWSKREKDVMLQHPAGVCTIADARFLSGVFNKEFTDELTRRGYDVSTLRFSIEPQRGNQRFMSQREVGK